MNFIARQPILSVRGDVVAYELLFRSGIENACNEVDFEVASTAMVDTLFLIGLQKLTEGRRAFINCPRDFLLRDYISLFPRDQVVVEILETVIPDEAVIEVCLRLKRQGYLIALDDFVESPAWAPMVALADYIKVDFRRTAPEERRELVERHHSNGIRMLAEKVETQEEFSQAKELGYKLFQGYFFCRPEIVTQRTIPAFRLAYLELLRAANAPDFDTHVLAAKIKHEASLTYKLLRYMNSAAFGLRGEIQSISHALVLLGEKEVRKWISVVSVSVMADGKPEELMTVPLVRARFCELHAPLAGMAGHENDLFLMGLLSVIDAILDQPLDRILEELPVRREIKQALLARTGVYRNLLDLAIAYEIADWEKLTDLAAQLRINEDEIPKIHVAAVQWASALRHGAREPVLR